MLLRRFYNRWLYVNYLVNFYCCYVLIFISSLIAKYTELWHCAGHRKLQEELPWREIVPVFERRKALRSIFCSSLYWIFSPSPYPHYYLDSRSWYLAWRKTENSFLFNKWVSRVHCGAYLRGIYFSVWFWCRKKEIQQFESEIYLSKILNVDCLSSDCFIIMNHWRTVSSKESFIDFQSTSCVVCAGEWNKLYR